MKAGIKAAVITGVAIIIVLSLAGLAFARNTDIQGHWAERQIGTWTELGLSSGYPDGSFRPDSGITRAEFITLVNKCFNFSEKGAVAFSDVSTADWFYNELAKAVAAGYISGYENGTFRPDTEISRQEVAAVLGRLLGLNPTEASGALSRFEDSGSIPEWASGFVDVIVLKGYMSGYPDGTFGAGASITRAEAIAALDRVSGICTETSIFEKAGAYGEEAGVKNTGGSVIVRTAGVTIQNIIIPGDLVITGAAGPVTLKNVAVKGSIIIRRGGSDLFVIKGAEGISAVLDGASIKISSGFTVSLLVDGKAEGAKIYLEKGVSVRTMTLNAATSITGEGKIETAYINVSGSSIDQQPGKVILGEGVEVQIGLVTPPAAARPSGGGGGGGGGGSSAPKIISASLTLGGNTYSISIPDGYEGTIDFNSVDPRPAMTDLLTGGTVKIAGGKCELKLTKIITDTGEINLSGFLGSLVPAVQLESGPDNIISVKGLLGDKDTGEPGVSLSGLKNEFGKTVKFVGTLTKTSSGRQSVVSLTVVLPE